MDNVTEASSSETSSTGNSISEAKDRFFSMLEAAEPTAEREAGTEANSAPSEANEPADEAAAQDANPSHAGDVVDDAEAQSEQTESAPIDWNKVTGEDEIVFQGKTIKLKDTQFYTEHSAYKQGTREVAEAKRKFEADSTALRGHAISAMDAIRRDFIAALPPEPNWENLLNTDPDEYTRQKHQWDNIRAKAAQFERQYQTEVEGKRQAEHAAQQQAVAECHTELRRMHPEFNDEVTGPIVTQNFGKWLNGLGFPREAIMGETNPMVLSLAFQLFQRMEAEKNTKAAVARVDAMPALTKPGSATTKPTRSQADVDAARAKRTGDISDAAKRWAHLI